MFVELTKFIRKDVSVRNKVKVLFTIPFLHSDYIETKSVLTSNLVTLRKMIYFLILIETLIEITLAAG